MCRASCDNLFSLEETVCTLVEQWSPARHRDQHTAVFGGREIYSAVGHSRAVVTVPVPLLRDLATTGEGLSPTVCVCRPGEGLTLVVVLELGKHLLGIAFPTIVHSRPNSLPV